MTTEATREQILDAAENLFAERGYGGASVRAITELAGVNLASVRYHFGSKAELMAAVARRVTEPITAAQLSALDRAQAGGAKPTVAELVDAFAGPMFDGVSTAAGGGARTSRLIVMIITDPADEVRSWTGALDDTMRERYFSAFAEALPDLSKGELWVRIRAILAVVAVDRLEFYTQRRLSSRDSARRWALTLLTAAMSAPPTPD